MVAKFKEPNQEVLKTRPSAVCLNVFLLHQKSVPKTLVNLTIKHQPFGPRGEASSWLVYLLARMQ